VGAVPEERILKTGFGLDDRPVCPGCGRPLATPLAAEATCPSCGLSRRSFDAGGSASRADPDAGAGPSGDVGASLARVLELPEFTKRFEVTRKLGQGGMGAVFVARDRSLERTVALKLVLGDDLEHLRRFHREGQVLARLSHPNILRVFSVESFGETPVLVMELLEGRTLKADLARLGRYEPAAAVDVGIRLLDGLAAAHAQGVVHRDLKPDNILLVDSEETLKILDFGLARQVGPTSQAAAGTLTVAGTLLGTPVYMSPEQCRGEKVDARCDLYAVGVILFELVTGRVPFTGSYPMEILLKHIQEKPPSLATLVPGIPAAIDDVVRRALSKRPEERFADALDLREALLGQTDSKRRKTGRVSERTTVPSEPMDAPGRGRQADRHSGSAVGRRMTRPVTTSPAATRGPGSAGARRGPTKVVAAVATAGLCLALALMWRSRPIDRSPVVAATGGSESMRVSNLRAFYSGTDRLVVTFRTMGPSRWSLLRSGARVGEEEAAAIEHRFEVAVPVGRPVESLELATEGARVDVELPPSPSELIRKLNHAVLHLEHLGETSSNHVWLQMTEKFADRMALGSMASSLTAKARAAVSKDPSLARPLDDLVARITGRGGLSATLEALRPHVGKLLALHDLPPELRDALLAALWPLDQLDCLAGYLGRPAPFGIQSMLAPAIRVEARIIPDSPSPIDAGWRPVFPAPGGRRAALFDKTKRPMEDSVEHLEASHLQVTDALTIEDVHPAGPGGRRLHFQVDRLGLETYLRITPPGWKSALPVRLPPDTDTATARARGQDHLVTIALRGAAAAGPGKWLVESVRAMESRDRYYIVRAVADEPLASPDAERSPPERGETPAATVDSRPGKRDANAPR
jgi:serine/threonine-protein kinase